MAQEKGKIGISAEQIRNMDEKQCNEYRQAS